jgi:hypothetical protein
MGPFNRSKSADILARLEKVEELLSDVVHARNHRSDFQDAFIKLRKAHEALRKEQLESKNGILNTLDAVIRQLNYVAHERDKLSAEAHQWLSLQSLGIETSEVRLTRFIPLRVYLSEVPEHGVETVDGAVTDLAKVFGFEIADDFPGIQGSWYKKWFARTKRAVTHPEVIKRLDKIERAIELQNLQIPQAEVDGKQAEAVINLMKSIENVPSAAIQVGSILLIKVQTTAGPILQVRTLTQNELIQLENNQKLLCRPINLAPEPQQGLQLKSKWSQENQG